MIAYWQKDARNSDGFNSNMPVPMDFNIQENIIWALNDENQGWDNGFVKVYNILAQDFIYANPDNLLIFLENHDVARLAEFLNNNLQRVKLAYTILATMRGIPQIYMGSELFMKNPMRPHDCDRRMDMIGGWDDDRRNAFTNGGRTAEERELFDYLKNIFQWRKTSKAVKEGKLLQFFPIDNHFYFYFRIADNQIVMTVINNGKEARNMDWLRCEEILKNVKNIVGTDIISGSKIKVGNLFAVPAGQAAVVEWLF
jgi:glycosidase